MSWATRQIIWWATIYHDVTHTVEDGIEKIVIDQVLSGGAGSSREERLLDWQERSVDDKLYGPLVTKTRRAQLKDIDSEYVRTGWIDDGKGVIETYGVSDTPKSGRTWVAETVSIYPLLSAIPV